MSTLLSPELLQQMISDSRYCSEFKFLCSPPIKSRGGCGRCGKGASQQVDWNQLKRNILGMPDNRRTLMKNMLGVTELKIWYRDSRGRQQSENI